jgi:serine/threonine-protein kinase
VLYEMLTGDVPFHGDSPVAVAMQHVREELPDVQRRRAHVSAALAAVVERATAKDLNVRYPDADSLAADLEDVLAIETARSGQASGEATMVLRSLPSPTRKRVPFTARRSRRWLLGLALLAAVAAGVVVYLLRQNTHAGVAPPPVVVVPPHLKPVPLAQDAAHDYNPFGTGPQNREQDGLAVDGDPNTLWSTEHYDADTPAHASGGVGVGLYLDASPGVSAQAIEVQTPTPGFAAQVYAANQINQNLAYGDTTPLTQRGWVGPLGSSSSVNNKAQIRLATAGRRYRYYLFWITAFAPGQHSASIAELTLFQLSR